MKTTLFLSVDLHAHEWFNPHPGADPAIWLCVQPHVLLQGDEGTPVEERYADVRGFVENAGSADAFTFEVLDGDAHKDDDFIPVNLPTDVDLSITWKADGPILQPNPNTRTEGMRLIDPADFRQDNSEAPSADTVLDGNPIENPGKEPFAAAYNDALNGALRGIDQDPDATLQDLAEQLILAFWGGTRRRIRTGVTIDPGDIEYMKLGTGDTGDLVVTNLHSLNGLMFRVLGKDDLPQLGAVRDLEIRLVWSGGAHTICLSDFPPENGPLGPLRDFFKTLPDVRPDVLEDLQPESVGRFGNRVYVDDQLIGFAPQYLEIEGGIENETWFRRRAERREYRRREGRRQDAGARYLLSDLSRLVVHLSAEASGGAPAKHLEGGGSLTFAVADMVECRLQRYRQGGARKAGDWIVARLTPTAIDRAQFERELAADPDCFRNGVVLDKNGKRIGTDRLRYIGSFRYPWENGERVVLFLAKTTGGDSEAPALGSLETVGVALIRRTKAGASVRVTVKPAGSRTREEGKTDPTGPRWELPPNAALPEVEFELLRLTDPAGDVGAGLIVSGAFKEDVEFVFANSAGRHEGVIKVAYPGLEGGPAEEEIREDTVNFNTMNVYHSWSAYEQKRNPENFDADARELENRNSELFPFWHEEDRKQPAKAAFHYLQRQTVQSPPGDLVGGEIVSHFKALYAAAGYARTLDFRLEHSYGSEIPLDFDPGKEPPTGTPLDVRPLLPSDVRGKVVREKVGEGSRKPDDPEPFLTARFEKVAGSDKLTLIFNRDYLDPDNAPVRTSEEDKTTSAKREAYVQAVRSLCELAFADRIELSGRFLAFDFIQALSGDPSTPVVSGLKPVPGFENNGWPIRLDAPSLPDDRNLQVASRRLLESWQEAAATVIIDLPAGSHPVISEVCNVVEFSLHLRRDSNKIPGVNDDWERVRLKIRPTKLLPTGPETIAAQGTDDGFARFLHDLRDYQAPILPDTPTREGAHKLLGLLSESGADAAGAWIVPQGFSRIDDAGITASLTPLGFVPVRDHPQLGRQTFDLLKRYLRGLQTILLLSPGPWVWTGEPDDLVSRWQELLRRLETLGSDVEALADAILELVLPVHLPVSLPKDEDPDPEVADAIGDLLREGDQTRAAVRAHIRGLFISDPSLFGDAKALLYTRLRDTARDRGITTAFHDWRVTRSTGDGHRRENRTLVYRDGLDPLAGTRNFGFVEVLLDALYDNAFTPVESTAHSFESLVEPFERDTRRDPRETRIALEDGKPKIPNADGSIVFLPSREGIREPSLASANANRDIDRDPDWVEAYRDSANKLDLASLLDGRICPWQAGSAGILRATLKPRRERSRELDDFVVTAVFQVWSDDEDGFLNDEFKIWITDTSDEHPDEDRRSNRGADRLPEGMLEIFRKLSASERVADMPDLPDVLDHLATVRNLFQSAPVEEEEATRGKPVIITVEEQDGNDSEFLKIQGAPPGLYVEAHLFRIVRDDNSDKTLPRPHYLVIGVERPIWRGTKLVLGQTRNRKDLEGPNFAPIFGFLSRGVTEASGQRVPVIREIVRKLSIEREIRWADLEQRLVSEGILNQSTLRGSFEVAVSVFHRQEGGIPTAFFDDSSQPNDAREPSVETLSDFPLEVVSISGDGDRDTLIRFPAPYTRFAMDLQWFSARNRPILRISRIVIEF